MIYSKYKSQEYLKKISHQTNWRLFQYFLQVIMPLSMSHGIPAGLRYALFDHFIEHDFGEQRLLNLSLLK